GLSPPDPSLTRGEIQVAANDLLRAALEPHLPNDPWGMMRFLYWLDERTLAATPAADRAEVDITLSSLSDELLLQEGFLEDIAELLREKGQVIFYGPPGTGKTFVAQKLAAALAGDENRVAIVQFHPSTSYEDFF